MTGEEGRFLSIPNGENPCLMDHGAEAVPFVVRTGCHGACAPKGGFPLKMTDMQRGELLYRITICNSWLENHPFFKRKCSIFFFNGGFFQPAMFDI